MRSLLPGWRGAISIVLLMGSLYLLGKTAYDNQELMYCQVMLGEENPKQFQVAISKRKLMIFRNGPWSVPETYALIGGKLVKGQQVPVFSLPNGESYKLISASRHRSDDAEPIISLYLSFDVQNPEAGSFRQYCDVILSSDANQTDVTHFGGPLKIDIQRMGWEIPDVFKMKLGGEPFDLRSFVGTFDQSVGKWSVVMSDSKYYREVVHPTATIEFPTASGQPIIKQYTLDQFC